MVRMYTISANVGLTYRKDDGLCTVHCKTWSEVMQHVVEHLTDEELQALLGMAKRKLQKTKSVTE